MVMTTGSQLAPLGPVTQSKTIKLSFVDVQKQSGGYDCGLLALVFDTALVNGINLGRWYLYN